MVVVYILSGVVQVTYVAKRDMVEESASCDGNVNYAPDMLDVFTTRI